ncbi:MAG: hypothetical protein K0R34_3126 [Herbinix sp.]|jgi:hypothetical protein|nr:hypothetical protein [Herbinix sp.]
MRECNYYTGIINLFKEAMLLNDLFYLLYNIN